MWARNRARRIADEAGQFVALFGAYTGSGQGIRDATYTLAVRVRHLKLLRAGALRPLEDLPT